MDVNEAYRIVNDANKYDFGKFYGVDVGGVLGVGQIYEGIRYPSLNRDDNLFDTLEGYVYIFTHECDIAKDNSRPFNEYLIVCPIIRLEDCLTTLNASLDRNALMGFFDQLGMDRVSRVLYLPTMPSYDFGGVIYLNQMSHAHVSMFTAPGAKLSTSVTAYGLRIIDYKITNHLLRPKSASLPLIQY